MTTESETTLPVDEVVEEVTPEQVTDPVVTLTND